MKEELKLMLGDNMLSLKELEDNSVDSIVTDPPYALTSIKKRFGKEGSAPAQFGTDGAFQRASKGFMGKEWDAEVPQVEFWKEVYRVLKPGGHVLSFGGSRTYHRMAVAIEDAGFEVRDQIMWVYGSGFPKSHNIGKAIDKIQGNESKIKGFVPRYPEGTRGEKSTGDSSWFGGNGFEEQPGMKPVFEINNDWEGWGTALKPAHEPICMARKPLSEKSIAENVLKWGTGGINIDGSRIEFEDTPNAATNPKYRAENNYKMPEPGQESNGAVKFTSSKNEYDTSGRFPANIMFDEEAGKILDEQSGISITGASKPKQKYDGGNLGGGNAVKDYPSSKGGASRFFYSPKVSKKERNAGLDGFELKSSAWMSPDSRTNKENYDRTSPGLERFKPQPRANNHPTVKPIQLMSYLIKLITPKEGVVMDCFMGSGSTGIAARLNGFKFIGMEMDEDYMEIAKARINGYEEYRQFLK